MRDPFQASANIVRFATPLARQTSLQTLPFHAHEVLAAFAFYNFIDRYFSPYISKRFSTKTYTSLPERSRTNWNAHIVSLVQSIFINSLALWVIYADKERWAMSSGERVWGYTGSMGLVQACSAGYFLWDLIAASWRPDVHGKGAILHALCASAVSLLGFVRLFHLVDHRGTDLCERPFVNYYGINFVLYELSTPFLNFHWFMDKLGMTGSNYQLVNGIALITSFGGCRLVWGPYQNYRMFKDIWEAYNTPGANALPVPPWLAATYVLACSTLTCLNAFWFSKMIQALVARFDKGEEGPKEKKQQ